MPAVKKTEGEIVGPLTTIEPSKPPAPVATSDADRLVMMIDRAIEAGYEPEKVEQYFGLLQRVRAADAKRAYDAAYSQMQPKLPIIGKKGDIKNKFGAVQSKYALWEDIVESIRPVLAEYGFALSFRTRVEGSTIIVTGILAHAEGHETTTELPVPADTSGAKNAVQAIGSSVSYGKRYVASALLNLAAKGEDDDARGAGGYASDAQIAEITNLVEETKTADAKIFEFAGVPNDLWDEPSEAYRKIPADKVASIIGKLKARQKMMQARKGGDA